MGVKLKEPEGISFYSIKTGETFYAKLEPTISAMINSSDMGINASRGQDFGWRLHPDWVKKVRDFKRDESKMDTLSAKLRLEEGQTPSTTQILYYIYGRQVRAYIQRLEEEENPFAEEYQKAISGKQVNSGGKKQPTHIEAALEDDTISEVVDEDDLLPADDEPIKSSPKK